MGFIQRQGLKFSIVNLSGLFIGALSTVYLYPRVLAEQGLLRFLLDTSTFLFPFVSLGANAVSVRFFPRFQDKEQAHRGFLALLLLMGLAGFALFALFALIFWRQISEWYGAKSALYPPYLWLIVPLTLLTLFNTLFNQYATNFKRIVVPAILFDFSQKIALPLLLLAYLARWITLDQLTYGIVAHSACVLIGFIWYINRLTVWKAWPDWRFISGELRGEMARYAGFNIISGIGYMAVMRLDTIIVPTFLGAVANGVYSITSFITNVLMVPMRAVSALSGPLFSKYWEEGNHAEIDALYRKASINLLIPGLLMFGAFWVSVDDFFRIIPKVNREVIMSGKPVILLLGLARLYDLATGVNNYLLGYSRYYYQMVYSLLALAVVSVTANLLLTPAYGMAGAAAAMLLMTVCYNSFTLILIWRQFNIQPFTIKTLQACIVALAVYVLVCLLLPSLSNPYAAILTRSGAYAALFGIIVIRLRLSEELNEMLGRLLKRSL